LKVAGVAELFSSPRDFFEPTAAGINILEMENIAGRIVGDFNVATNERYAAVVHSLQ
jgi:hypothetical protein